MKIVVLGGAGMLGHKLVQRLAGRHQVWATFRSQPPGALPAAHLTGVDAYNFPGVAGAIEAVQPDAVVNCIGIVKQLAAAADPVRSVAINSLLPHQIAQFCVPKGIRFVHISTDCVFSGRKGNYTEDDPADAGDLYGKSKHLGEVHDQGCLTIRTSIIGPELNSSHGLLEWFLGRNGEPVRGYTKAFFTGFPTVELARIIENVLCEHKSLTGLYQVASARISKHDLLSLIRNEYHRETSIEPDDSVSVDRSLDGTRFRVATNYNPPSWPELIRAMAADHIGL